MDNPLISVIVPVYNVEKHLDRCVESIVNQTYTNLEIILVDDGSPDNCPAMCDAWAEKDNRIKVIHKENGGLSSARNAGLDVMTGEYVYFIDSDDYINEITISTLYNLINEYNADMSFGRYYRVFDSETDFYQPEFTDEIFLFDEDSFWNAHYDYDNDNSEYSVNLIISCNKLYKSELFDALRFEYGKIHEDEYIIHKIVQQCNCICFINKKLYYYFQNSSGIMSQRSSETYLYAIESLAIRTQYFASQKKEYTIYAFKSFFGFFRWNYFSFGKQLKKDLMSLYRDTYNTAKWCIKNDTLNNRLIYKAFYINDNVFRVVNKVFSVVNKVIK